MHVELSAEQAKYVDEQLATGKYSSAAEVVAHAFRVMRNVERAIPAAEDDLRREIDLGLCDLDEGRASDWNVEELKSFILSNSGGAAADKKAS